MLPSQVNIHFAIDDRVIKKNFVKKDIFYFIDDLKFHPNLLLYWNLYI